MARGRPQKALVPVPKGLESDKPKPEPVVVKALVALSRCKYSDTGGKQHTVERGGVFVSPDAKDIADLREANLVAEMDSDLVEPLQRALEADPVAVRAILGV